MGAQGTNTLLRLPLPVVPQVGFFDDKVGPITLAVLVLLTMLIIFTLALVDYFN